MEDKIGSITPGKKADLLLIKNDQSPAMTPILNPYAHVVYQAGTADVHTVVVNGRVLKYDGKRIGLDIAPARDAVAASVEYVRSQLGEQAWEEGMHPPLEPRRRSRTRTSTPRGRRPPERRRERLPRTLPGPTAQSGRPKGRVGVQAETETTAAPSPTGSAAGTRAAAR